MALLKDCELSDTMNMPKTLAARHTVVHVAYYTTLCLMLPVYGAARLSMRPGGPR